MKILAVSDLHLEFHRDGGEEITKKLGETEADVLVLAGDITVFQSIPKTLKAFCKLFPNVVFVLGNHEFYGSNYLDTVKQVWVALSENPNLHFLHSSVKTIGGVKFVGTTLWFRPSAAPKLLNDFSAIRDFEEWVYHENEKSVEFLQGAIEPGCVVVTHHAPSFKSVNAKFEGSPINAYFVCDVEKEIRDGAPSLWIHGHMHDSSDYKIGDTRVVCNPLGYPQEANAGFETKVIDIPEICKPGSDEAR